MASVGRREIRPGVACWCPAQPRIDATEILTAGDGARTEVGLPATVAYPRTGESKGAMEFRGPFSLPKWPPSLPSGSGPAVDRVTWRRSWSSAMVLDPAEATPSSICLSGIERPELDSGRTFDQRASASCVVTPGACHFG